MILYSRALEWTQLATKTFYTLSSNSLFSPSPSLWQPAFYSLLP